jgi:hypothetical protein
MRRGVLETLCLRITSDEIFSLLGVDRLLGNICSVRRMYCFDVSCAERATEDVDDLLGILHYSDIDCAKRAAEDMGDPLENVD